MNSERSDIDVKVALDIQERAWDPDTPRAILVELKPVGGEIHAVVKANGFPETDAGARAVSEALDLVALGIESALPDEDPEAEQDEAIIQELIKAGVDEHIARGDGLKTVKMFALALPPNAFTPDQVPMHPQDPERGTATEQAMQRAVWAKPTVQSFETPQHVREARSQRRAERKGFNPKPKGGQ